MVDLHEAQLVAATAARRAGAGVSKAHAARTAARARNAGDVGAETQAQAAEVIRAHLLRNYPGHAVDGEQQDAHAASPYRWRINPLDGAANFLHGLPQFVVSLALEAKGQVVVSVVHEPLTGTLYTARQGGGTFRNGKRVQVSPQKDLETAMLSVKAPRPDRPELPDYLRRFCTLSQTATHVRSSGAASLDMAGVAGGCLDGFFAMDCMRQDAAAGSLLVREAGGVVSPLPGSRPDAQEAGLVATTPGILDALLRVLT